MVTTEFTTTPATTGERLQLFALALVARVGGLWRAAVNRRAVGRLLDLDERMLRDIGVTSSDVRAAMSMPLLDDPSQRLRVLAVERRAAHRAQAHERLLPGFRLKSLADEWRRPNSSGGAA